MAKSKRLSQIGMIIFMVLIAFGFIIPGFINAPSDEGNTQQYVEPRLCQNDVDCYLTCDDTPVIVLCSQNLCVQNSCAENSPYKFVQDAATFSLNINANNSDVTLVQQDKNLFLNIEGNTVRVHADTFPLGEILHRVGVTLAGYCAHIGASSYCSPEWNISLMLNGNSTSIYAVPQNGDVVDVTINEINNGESLVKVSESSS